MGLGWGIRGLIAVQALCTLVFVWDLGASVLGLRTTPVSWQLREVIEIGAALGLLTGLGLGAMLLTRAQRRTVLVEEQLRAASGAFMDVLEDRFTTWALTPAERDVALFLIKGMTTAEIAALRSTSDGTVKAQTNAIYRKAGVGGRPQLLSLFIDELMGDGLTGITRPR